MQPRTLKYLLDIQVLIAELASFKEIVHNDFFQFRDQVVVKRAVERNLEIIGEAVRSILDIDPECRISSARKIVGLRNILAHGYDGVDDELLWAILQRDIPVLKKEVDLLLRGC
jgi:uncharacterized protein with HEPN domain